MDLFPIFLNTGTTDETFQQSGKQDAYCRVQQVRRKVRGHSSLESPLEYNDDQIPLRNQGLL